MVGSDFIWKEVQRTTYGFGNILDFVRGVSYMD